MGPFAFIKWNSNARLNRMGNLVLILLLNSLAMSCRSNSLGNDAPCTASILLGWVNYIKEVSESKNVSSLVFIVL